MMREIQPINWELPSNVINMNGMFQNSPFNQIFHWNTSSVEDMAHMFLNSPFNQPIGVGMYSMLSI